MICQACNQSVATVHLTEIMNKQKKEVHLCEECAREKGITHHKDFSFQDLLGHLTGASAAPKPAPVAAPASEAEAEESGAERESAATTCPSCGLTFGEFRSTGRLGCPEDYVHFKRGLTPLLEKIHGSTQHVGKVPGADGKVVSMQRDLTRLRQNLNVAIQNEEYERAAELRDQIRSSEEQEKTE